MADTLTTTTTLSTIPNATVIATDDCGVAGQAQIVKLAIATDGSATLFPGDATDGLLVNLGANNDVTVASLPLPTGASTAARQDTGNTSLASIDGKITAVNTGAVTVASSALPTGASTAAKQPALGTAGTPSADVISVQGVASGTVIPISVASIPSHAVTNAGTFATQVDGDALTALQLIDNAVSGAGFNITQFAGVNAVSGSGTATGAVRVELPTNGTGVIATVGAVTAITNALPAGTNAIGKLAANSGVDIGDVDVTSIIPGTGATNLGKAEDGAHTSGDVGVAAWGVRTDTPNAERADTDLDYTPIATSAVGSVRTAPPADDFAVVASGGVHVKKYYTNAGAVTDGIVWSPAAGKRWYVTDIFIGVSAAATLTLEDDVAAGDVTVFKMEFAANSGWGHTFSTPLFSGEDAADLLVTTTAGNVYITITGYEI